MRQFSFVGLWSKRESGGKPMRALWKRIGIAIAVGLSIGVAHGAVLTATNSTPGAVDSSNHELPPELRPPGVFCFPQGGPEQGDQEACFFSRTVSLSGSGVIRNVQFIFVGELVWVPPESSIDLIYGGGEGLLFGVGNLLRAFAYNLGDIPITLVFDAQSPNLLPTERNYPGLSDSLLPPLVSGTYNPGVPEFPWIPSDYDPAGWTLTYTMIIGDWHFGDATRITSFSIVAYTVPEPASLALLGLAFAGLSFARRRKLH